MKTIRKSTALSNRSEYVPSYGYREQPTKTEQRLYGELVRPVETSQVLTKSAVKTTPTDK